MKTSKGKRLHGAAALLASLKLFREMLIPLVIIMVSQGFRGGYDDRAFYWRLGIGGALVVAACLWGVLQWIWFRYKVEDGVLKVEAGIVFKTRQSIPLARIQTVDFSEGLIHRLLGLVRVQVQTAGGTKPEAVLAAVTREEAEALERRLSTGSASANMSGGLSELSGEEWTGEGTVGLEYGAEYRPEQTMEQTEQTEQAMEQTEQDRQQLEQAVKQETGQVLAEEEGSPYAVQLEPRSFGATGEGKNQGPERRLPFAMLFLAGLTASNLGVGMSLLFAVLSQADELFPSLRIFQSVSQLSGVRVFLIIGAVAMFIAWLLAVVSSVLRFAGFTVQKRGDELFITRGLLERSRVTLPIRRIQAVRIVQEPLWKPFGLAAVHVVSAGYGNEKGESTLIFPLMRTSQIPGFLEQFCPDYAVDLEHVQLASLPGRARWGYLLPAPLFTIGLAALVWAFATWGRWGFIAAAVVALLQWRAHRRAAYAYDEKLLIMRSSLLSETVAIIPRRRIQYTTIRQNPLQRRSGLSTMQVALASHGSFGTHFRMKGMPLAEAAGLIAQERSMGQIG